ncbi:MAG TPA: mechanosensitive ion channel family protein [Terriglobales bacterium]|jgi:MscS family membrane protein|nr:mechanosensitive ion channel family protein [Terriglobales bacterium]
MNTPDKCAKTLGRAAIATLMVLLSPTLWAQLGAAKNATPEVQPEVRSEVQPEPPKDPLNRSTPRKAVLGFLNTVHRGNIEVAALYLNTPLRGPDAQTLAKELAVVLDRRLPARLNEISDEPEGSMPDPLNPDEDLVGTISTSEGDLDILVERIDRGKLGKAWLFSRKTLKSIPGVYDELSTPAVEKFLPEFLVKKRLASIPLFEWLALLGVLLLFVLFGLLGRLIGLVVSACRRYLLRNADLKNPQVLSSPIRLLLVAFSIYWLLSRVGLPLLARQFWSTIALIIVVIACIWLLVLFNRWGERFLVARRPSLSGSAAMLRLVRRGTNGLIFFAGLLFALHHFGVDPTAALAGLGVGGIAVALAAQKTLENLIAGISLITDQAVRVGDTLKLGDVLGTVEDVGLRSTRIRTLDRSLVCVPNGQIANMSLETLSARDKFWFHPVVGLRYETTPVQLRSIITSVRKLLTGHSSIDSSTVRVCFLRVGACSLDVDIFAYVFARNWDGFLKIQEELLFNIINIVSEAGTEIAFPSQTLYLAAGASDKALPFMPEIAGKRSIKANEGEPGMRY